MQGDLKEVVGTLMRVLGGARISREEVEELAFDASDELETALNRAFVQLLQYAYDCDAGVKAPLRPEVRACLEDSLDEIIRLSDVAAK